MKISVLSENLLSPHIDLKKNPLTAEHGLSFFIQTENHNILFDFGQSDSTIKNAQVLGIDLATVDIAILSHGHYDHSGGLWEFLKINDKAKIYINENALFDYYNADKKYIGIDLQCRSFIQSEIEKKDSRFIITKDYYSITDKKDLQLFTCNEKNLPLETYGLCQKLDSKFIPEKFLHEQYLLIKENDKKILFSSCSHKGIINLVKVFSPDYIFGGFHFMKIDITKDKLFLEKAAQILKNSPSKFFTCHCTGIDQYQYLKTLMPDNLSYIYCGSSIKI